MTLDDKIFTLSLLTLAALSAITPNEARRLLLGAEPLPEGDAPRAPANAAPAAKGE